VNATELQRPFAGCDRCRAVALNGRADARVLSVRPDTQAYVAATSFELFPGGTTSGGVAADAVRTNSAGVARVVLFPSTSVTGTVTPPAGSVWVPNTRSERANRLIGTHTASRFTSSPRESWPSYSRATSRSSGCGWCARGACRRSADSGRSGRRSGASRNRWPMPRPVIAPPARSSARGAAANRWPNLSPG
jgi:hypothetical protein